LSCIVFQSWYIRWFSLWDILVKGRVLLAFSHTLFSKQSSAVITVSLMLTERIRWKTAYGLNGDSSLKIKTS
jgi:hypothetical protein